MSNAKNSTIWSELIDSMSSRFASLTDHVLENLRELLRQGQNIVNAAEAALMVPAADPAFLKFLVSVNSKPGIEEIVTQMTIPCDESIVGCVFNTGQLIAVANPEDFYQQVDEKTGLKTSIYLVTPVLDDDEILGVMTFVNRPDEDNQEMFNETEIQASIRLAEITASGLRYYQRMNLQQRLFEAELSRCADQFSGNDPYDISFDHQTVEMEEQSPLARAIVMLERLSQENQDLAAELISVLQARTDGSDSSGY